MNKLFLPALALLSLAVSSASAATTVTWALEGDGYWDVGTNWSNGTGPAAGDTVTLHQPSPGDVVTLNSEAPTLAALNLAVGGISGIGTLDVVDGGVLNVTGAISFATSNAKSGNQGYLNQSGGSVTAGSIAMGSSTGARQGFYDLSAGTLSVSGNVTLGSSGNGFITQTGGSVSIGGTLALVSAVNNAGTTSVTQGSYTISGGVVNLTDVKNGAATDASKGTGRSTFSVQGSAATINVAGSYTTGTQSSETTGRRESYLAFGIDSGGVSKINITGDGTVGLAGTLQTGFVGGVALASATQFTLIEANTGNISGTFDTALPNADLWNAPAIQAVSGTRDALVISLNPAAKAGDLSYTGSFSQLDFGEAKAFGYVTLTDLSEDTVFRLSLEMNPGSSDIPALLAYFAANGISAAVSTVDGFDVDLFLKSSGEVSQFAWDMTQFDSGASISAIGVEAVPEPSTVALAALSGLGLFWRMRRRIAGGAAGSGR